jgi:hypothetical protein
MFELRIEELEPLAPGRDAVAEILGDVGGDPAARLRAAGRTLAHTDARGLLAGAADAVTARATDTHDFKVLAAVIEDHQRVSPPWRARYLAACTARLRGPGEPISPVGRRIVDATRGLS